MPGRFTLAASTAFVVLVAVYLVGAVHREKQIVIAKPSTTWTRKGLGAPPSGGDAVDCVKREDLAAAAAAAAPPAAPDEPEPPFTEITWPNACPQWLLDYEKFHAKHRGKPGAKYLLHHVTGEAGGTGDRIRGMLFSVRAAAAMGRVLLAKWDHPYDLTHFFVPSGSINWTLEGIDVKNGTLIEFMNDFYNATIIDGHLLNVTDPWLTFQTNNFMAGQCPWCAPLESAWSDEAACLFHKVLKPTDEITAMADAAIDRLYGQPRPRFIAVHLRLGGLIGEVGTPERGWVEGNAAGPLPHFLGALRCANALAANHTFHPGTTPTLLVTDNIVLRRFIADGGLPHVVGPADDPVHTDFARAESLEMHKKTFVDIILLSKGECLVWSASGFSHMAWLLGGGKPCRVRTTQCTPGLPERGGWRNDWEWRRI